MKKLLSLILFSAFATLMVAQTYEVETIHESPAGSKGLNIVVLSEGYTFGYIKRIDQQRRYRSFDRKDPAVFQVGYQITILSFDRLQYQNRYMTVLKLFKNLLI